MKPNVKKSVLSVFLFFVISLHLILSPGVELTEEKRNEQTQKFVRETEWKTMYELVVESIKHQEGFMSTSYYCPGGILTIGYGHAIKPGEFFNEPMSEEEADRLLRQDLDSAIAFVRKSTNLEHIQLLAMGRFVYNVGSGNFYRSTLRQLIIANEPIDEEIIKWIHIRTDKGFYKSDWLLQSRQMELKLFKLET